MHTRTSLWTRFVKYSTHQRLLMLGCSMFIAFLVIEFQWRLPLHNDRHAQRQQLNTFITQAIDQEQLDTSKALAQAPLQIPQDPIAIEQWQFTESQGHLKLIGAADALLDWIAELQKTPWLFDIFTLEAHPQGLRLTGRLQQQQQRQGKATAKVPTPWQRTVAVQPPNEITSFREVEPLISCAPNFSWDHDVIAVVPSGVHQEARIATRRHPALMPISYYLPALTNTTDTQVQVSATGEFRLFAPDRDCIPVEFPLLPARSSPVFWLP